MSSLEKAAQPFRPIGSPQSRQQLRRGLMTLAVVVGAALLILPGLQRLSYNAWLGATAAGLCFAFVALGVYLSFRILDYPDLTIDGSFPLGAAIAAALIVRGYHPLLSLPAAMLGGALAGLATALIATRLQLHSLLASILTTTALFSINLHVMGRSNIPLLDEPTIFSQLSPLLHARLAAWGGVQAARYTNNLLAIVVVGVLVFAVKAGFDWFMRTEYGLASILTTTALFSINLHVMGRSNIPLLDEPTIFSQLSPLLNARLAAWGGVQAARYTNNLLAIVVVGVLVFAVKAGFDWFMRTEYGLALQATGDNPQMARSLGVDTDRMALLGLAFSNALVGLSGAIFAQFQGFADINMGSGLIIAGLAAVILGETFLQPRRIAAASLAVVIGMVVYRLAIAAALNINFPLPGGASFRIDPLDVKLATALLVLAALWLTRLRKRGGRK